MMSKLYRIFLLPLLMIGLFSCKDDIPAIDQNQVIKIEAESSLSSLLADGQTVLNFKASIPANAVEEARNVTFYITSGLGTFQGTVVDGKNNVQADLNGIARTSLKLGSTAGTFYISASVTRGGTVYRSQDLPIVLTAPAAGLLSLTSDLSQPEANGFTLLTINLTSTDLNEKTVELNTNLGTFTQSSTASKIQLSFTQGKASTLLRISNQASAHIITATSGLAKTALLSINPQISRPQQLLVEPSALLVDSVGGSIQLKTFLRRTNIGEKVSQGYPVTFRAYQTKNGTQVIVGRFTGTPSAISDGDGNVPAVNFFADSGNIDTSKEITLDCATFKSATEEIHVLSTVRIKK